MLLKTQKDSHSKYNQTLSPTRGRKSCDRHSLLLYFFYRCINVYGRRIFTTHITHNMQISVDSIGQLMNWFNIETNADIDHYAQ